MSDAPDYDLLVIDGGINGAGDPWRAACDYVPERAVVQRFLSDLQANRAVAEVPCAH